MERKRVIVAQNEHFTLTRTGKLHALKLVDTSIAGRALALSTALDHEQVQAVPRDQRCNAMLRDECQALGIVPSAHRHVMLLRLADFHAGRPTVTLELVRPELNAPARVESLTVDRRPAPVYATGDMQLLGLPHEVLRYLLSFLPHLELGHMLRVCKYVHGDALLVLIARARDLFGYKGSPLAVSALAFYESLLAAKLALPRYKNRPNFWAQTAAWKEVKTKMQLQGFETVDYDIKSESVLDRIRLHLDVRGSVEYIYQQRARRAELREHRSKEAKYLQRGAPERLAVCIKIFERAGFPRLFDWTEERGFVRLPICEAFESLCAPGFESGLAQLRRVRYYILRGTDKQPACFGKPFACHDRLRSVLLCLEALPAFETRNFYCTALCRFVRCVRFASAPNLAILNSENMTRLFAYLAALPTPKRMSKTIFIWQSSILNDAQQFPVVLDGTDLLEPACATGARFRDVLLRVLGISLDADCSVYCNDNNNVMQLAHAGIVNTSRRWESVVWVVAPGYVAPEALNQYLLQ